MSLEIFTSCIRKKTNLEKPIGNVIVNQKIIYGLGNYLRADILWLSKINPFRKTKTLTDIEIENIFKYTRDLTWGNYDKEYAIKEKFIKKNIKLPYDYNRLFFLFIFNPQIFIITQLLNQNYIMEDNEDIFIGFQIYKNNNFYLNYLMYYLNILNINASTNR